VLQNGQSYVVTGPGLPAGGETVKIDSSQPKSITLPTPGTPQTPPVQQYVSSALSGQSISTTAHFIQGGFTLAHQPSGSQTNNGLVMWYHSLYSQAPDNSAPFQLTEFTFRGTFYDPAINTGTGFQYLLGSLAGIDTDSADYDLSFVDTINMPVAIEATNVSIPYTTVQEPYGWVGSGQELADFQATLDAFTTPNPKGVANANFLGTYLGGQGYPSYVKIDPGNTKLPAGQNLFLASPVVAGPTDIQYYVTFPDGSFIKEPLYALTSGGSGPISLTIGGDPAHPSQGHFLGLHTSGQADQFALDTLMAPNIGQGFVYSATSNGNQPAGNVIGLYRDKNQNIIGVELDRDVPPNASSQVYNFTLQQKDYAGGGIAGLWYSWAKNYADNVQSTPMSNVPGTISGNIVTLNSPAPGLVPGMTVTGAGIPAGCIVLAVSSDHQTIELSTVASGSPTSFNFAQPRFASIVGFDESSNSNTPLVPLSFPSSQQATALAFAQTVYVVMSAWSVTVTPGAANGWTTLFANIIGGNLGPTYLPNANPDVVVALTNMSKSALRGVPDFTSPLYSNPAQWYPDPTLPAGGQTYNVFNLDPFVWFIHEKLGLSAYAFSLDDDVGNVQGGGANQVDFSIGGLGGLPNRDPYTPTSQWVS
jgi:hypothetical protein